MTPGERLQKLRRDAGYERPVDAARAMGANKYTYTQHENGTRDVSKGAAQRYAQFYGSSIDHLLNGRPHPGKSKAAGLREAPAPFKAQAFGDREVDRAEYTAIGRYDASFSAGPGSLIPDHPEPLGHHLVETQWLNALTRATPEQLAIVRVSGDSMVPTLLDGDWVLIDQSQRKLAREGIYALRVQDQAWVKRVSLNLREKLVRVISDNPVVPMQELQEEDIELIGRVISLVARRLA